MYATCKLQSKFNDTLNDAVTKIDQYILTVNSCNTYEDFNKKGNLSDKGMNGFWSEVDDLIQRFESGKVKLKPNPKNPPRFKKDRGP